MNESITCPSCQRRYAFKPALAGKRAKCKCGATISFPAPPPGAPALPRTAAPQAPTAPPPPFTNPQDLDALARVMMTVRNDTGPFHRTGNEFGVNATAWFGAAVVSPSAIYLLKTRTKIQWDGLRLAGGLLGSLIAEIGQIGKNQETISTCVAGDLPEVVRTEFDPVGKSGNSPVIIIAKSTVSSVEFRGNVMTGALALVHAGPDKFALNGGAFDSAKMQQQFEELGWTPGQDLQPTETPAHDTRTEEQRKSAKANDKSRWLFIGILALLILVLACAAIPFGGQPLILGVVLLFFAFVIGAAVALSGRFPHHRLKIAIALIAAGSLAFVPIPLEMTNLLWWYKRAIGENMVFVVGMIGFVLTVIGLFLLQIDVAKRRLGE